MGASDEPIELTVSTLRRMAHCPAEALAAHEGRLGDNKDMADGRRVGNLITAAVNARSLPDELDGISAFLLIEPPPKPDYADAFEAYAKEYLHFGENSFAIYTDQRDETLRMTRTTARDNRYTLVGRPDFVYALEHNSRDLVVLDLKHTGNLNHYKTEAWNAVAEAYVNLVFDRLPRSKSAMFSFVQVDKNTIPTDHTDPRLFIREGFSDRAIQIDNYADTFIAATSYDAQPSGLCNGCGLKEACPEGMEFIKRHS